MVDIRENIESQWDRGSVRFGAAAIVEWICWDEIRCPCLAIIV